MTPPTLLPVHEQQRADAELGASYRRAKAALPEGWHIRFQSDTFGGGGFCTAEAWAEWAQDAEQEFGVDETAAFTALAEALERRREAGK